MQKKVLGIGYFWLLATYTYKSATSAVGCFLTLIAKHFCVHIHDYLVVIKNRYAGRFLMFKANVIMDYEERRNICYTGQNAFR